MLLYTRRIVDDNDDYNDYCGFNEHKIDESSAIMWYVMLNLLNGWIKNVCIGKEKGIFGRKAVCY